jgi:hypothetical protein
MKEIAMRKWAWISIVPLEKLNICVNGPELKSLPDTLTHEAGGITGKLKGLIGNPLSFYRLRVLLPEGLKSDPAPAAQPRVYDRTWPIE